MNYPKEFIDYLLTTDVVKELYSDWVQFNNAVKRQMPFCSDEFMQAWIDWEKYRKEKRQKLTPSTVKRQIKFLAGFNEYTAIAIINQSIQNGWTGLFPIKNGTTKDKRSEQLNSLAADFAKRVIARNEGAEI